MARYLFCLADDFGLFQNLLTAELDHKEEIIERVELLAYLLSSAGHNWYDNRKEMRKILVIDDDGYDRLVVRLSDVIRNTQNH